MNNVAPLARNSTTPQPALEYGHVRAEHDGIYTIDTSFGDVRAQLAASCLLHACVGDKVLLSMDDAGEAYVLSVLVRNSTQASDITIEGDANLHVRDGDLKIIADNAMGIASGDAISMVTDKLGVTAASADVNVQRLSLTGKLLNAQIKNVKLVGKQLEHVAARFTQRVVNAFRFVKDHDEVQAGSSRQVVDETLSTHAKNTIHVAEDVVKIDGEEVHLG